MTADAVQAGASTVASAPVPTAAREPISFAFAWRHLAAYWHSSSRWKGVAWVVAVLLLIALANRLAVAQNDLSKLNMDATQRQDIAALMRSLVGSVLLMIGSAALGSLHPPAGRDGRNGSGAGLQGTGLMGYVMGGLTMDWRDWQTRHTIGRWLGGGAFHRIEREQHVENADQRIAEDLHLAIELTLALLFTFIETVALLFTFMPRLYAQSGSFSLTFGGTTLAVPGFMLWAAIAFALLLALLTQGVGRRLSATEARHEGAEAGFRFGLIRVRENAEQIAFYDGVAAERTGLLKAFAAVRAIWWRLIWRRHLVSFVNGLVQHFDRILPALLFAPRIVGGGATLGDLAQVSMTFALVVGQLTWFSNSFLGIARWVGVFRRLTTLDTALSRVEGSGIERALSASPRIAAGALQLQRPDGSAFSDVPAFTLVPGQRLLLRGPSGVGKSTLLRVLAGLWPHGRGRIELPAADALMFLPQRPYLPLGTLAEVLSYPSAPQAFTAAQYADALGAFGLEALALQLDVEAPWHQRLSPGEQQRVAACRVLLQCPQFLVVDEATSALDEAAERRVYRTLLDRLPQLALLSVAHAPGVEHFHDQRLRMAPSSTSA